MAEDFMKQIERHELYYKHLMYRNLHYKKTTDKTDYMTRAIDRYLKPYVDEAKIERLTGVATRARINFFKGLQHTATTLCTAILTKK